VGKGLTSFGVLSRTHRARRGLVMADQAKALGCSVSYISALERGARPIPADYPGRVANWLNLDALDAAQFAAQAKRKKASTKLGLAERVRTNAASEIPEPLDQDPTKELRQLSAQLSKADHCKFSPDQIRQYAQVARNCFELGNQLTFDLIDILENRIASVDPEFTLQVDPTHRMGERVAAYAAVVGSFVKKIVLSEHSYDAAKKQTPDGRFVAAHELAHWLLHQRTNGAAFQRYSRYDARYEHQADFFAREFLMPERTVRRFRNPSDLAAACNVPREQARLRMSELKVWPSEQERKEERLRIQEKLTNLSATLKANEEANAQAKLSEPEVSDFQLIPFPTAGRPQPPKRVRRRRRPKVVAESASLFEYVKDAGAQAPSGQPEKKAVTPFDFKGALQAIGFYAGYHRNCRETQTKPECNTSAENHARTANRCVDWYRRYGWR
jgi:transcriptional regulator with XRE-family HTH domain